MKITYKTSGVDIDRGNRLIDMIKPLARSTFTGGVMSDLGSFGAFFKLNAKKYMNPVLVSGTDGVGTKLKVAFQMNRHDTIGIDLVAMCVNDILTSGAQPLFFLDYFATGKLSIKQGTDVIRGIAEGCKMSDCSLIGGETAEMPGFYKKGEYDLSGFSVGVVDRKDIINGSKTKNSDVLIGLASSGIHSNGYSLVRKVFFDYKKYSPRKKISELGCTIGDELLKPTRIYVKSVLSILRSHTIKGIAHITGGGLTENLPRIVPAGKKLRFFIERGSWSILPVFDMIRTMGSVSNTEMFRTFNMGIGMVLVVDKRDSMAILRKLKRLGETAYIIGEIKKGEPGVEFV
jgi:phosphoribosylformylglycinamidine cyclo-ligase